MSQTSLNKTECGSSVNSSVKYAKRPEADAREIVIRAMGEIWRPITLTTLTTVAGFLGLYLASEMPPFRYLGLFSAVGVVVACFDIDFKTMQKKAFFNDDLIDLTDTLFRT